MSCFGGSRSKAKPCFTKEDIAPPVNPLTIADKGMLIRSMPVSEKSVLGGGAEVIRRKPNYFPPPGEEFDENVYDVIDASHSPVANPAPPPLPHRRRGNRNPASDPACQISRTVRNLPPDDFFANKRVLSLDNVTMKDYLQQNEAVFVLFYEPDNKASLLSKYMYSEAANKDGAASYTAVNCAKESVLCRLQDVKTLPVVKLFTKGALVNTYGLKELSENLLSMYSSTAPTIQQIPPSKSPCAVDEYAYDENM